MPRRGSLASAVVLAACLAFSGCECTHEAPAVEPRLETSSEAPDEPRVDTWPAPSIDLSARPPATRLTLRPGAWELDNRALVQTWPRAAVARAESAPGLGADGPRLVRSGAGDDGLEGALADARRIEAAATGAGGGAGIVDLRVAADLPFPEFEAALRAVALAGYGTPRVLLGEDDALVAFPWPRATSGPAPSEGAIRDALEAIRRGEEPSLGDPDATVARVRLTDVGARVLLRGEARCPDVTEETVGDCLRELLATRVTVEVAGDLGFGEVAPWVERASLATESLGVRSTR